MKETQYSNQINKASLLIKEERQLVPRSQA
jgi:hypothetical protein